MSRLGNVSDVPHIDFCLLSNCNTIPAHPLLSNLVEHLGSGSFGIAIGNALHCIKIMENQKLSRDELVFSNWASQVGVGPRLICCGTMLMSKHQLLGWAEDSIGKALPVPKWITALTDIDTVKVDYVAYERWDTNLWDVLQRYTLTEHLIEPIIPKYRKHLEIMRKHGVVHGDLLPRNILVRMKGDQLTDVCFTDFADAFPARRWFLNQWIDKSYRDLTIRCFTTFQYRLQLQQAIYERCKQNLAKPIEISKKECLVRWLLHNPYNLDACVLESLLAIFNKAAPIRIPSVFNFDLAWDDRGRIEVAFCHGTFKQNHVISGFKRMGAVRLLLSRHGSSRFGKLLFVNALGKAIAQQKEIEFWPSSFIVPDPNNRNLLCIFMEEAKTE